MDYWFHHNFKGTKSYQVWESGIDYLISNLDATFISEIHGRPTNTIMFETPLYCFGDSSIPDLNLSLAPGKNLKAQKIDVAKQHIIDGRLIIY